MHARSRSKKMSMHRRSARRSVNGGSAASWADDLEGTDGLFPLSRSAVTSVADGGQIHGMSLEVQ